MSNSTIYSIERVEYQRNDDPLLDMETLSEIGKRASEQAQARAFANGSPITIERDGTMVQIFPNGEEVILKPASNKPFPTLEEDLCL